MVSTYFISIYVLFKGTFCDLVDEILPPNYNPEIRPQFGNEPDEVSVP